MGKLTLKFNPIFIILFFISFYFGWMENFLVYIVVLLIHEFAHYITASAFGYKLNKIVFMPYGAGVSGDNNIFKPSHEILIALAGPAINIALAIITVCLWWLFPVTYYYTETFLYANLSLGLFNLLPVFPLDGGRVLVAKLSNKISKVKLYKAMKIIGISMAVLFATLFFISVFTELNLTFAFIAFFLGISSFSNIKDVFYERSYINNFQKELSLQKPMEVRTLVVNAKMPAMKLVKYIKGNNYTQFIILNDDNKIVRTISEQELLRLVGNIKK